MRTRTLIVASLVCIVNAMPALAEEARMPMAGQSMMMKPGETMIMMPNGMTAAMPATGKPMDPAMMQSAKPMENCVIMMMGEDGKMYMTEDMKMADGKMACDSMADNMAGDSMAMGGNIPIMAGGDAMMVKADTLTLMVDSVDAPSDGWIVVHAMADGKPGEVLGHAAVKKGMNTNISVDLSRKPASGDKLALMLHTDTGAMGTYEFGQAGSKEDAPVMQDGKPVMEMVTAQ